MKGCGRVPRTANTGALGDAYVVPEGEEADIMTDYLAKHPITTSYGFGLVLSR